MECFEREEDKLRDECGMVGVYLKKKEGAEPDFTAASKAYYALYCL